MESSTEDNQIPQSVFLDHKMIKHGIQYHEQTELQMICNEDGVEKSNLSYKRSIGDQTYTTNQKFADGEFKDETIETTLAEDEIAAFKKDWDETIDTTLADIEAVLLLLSNDWHERSTGVIKTFFKKLDDFLN